MSILVARVVARGVGSAVYLQVIAAKRALHRFTGQAGRFVTSSIRIKDPSQRGSQTDSTSMDHRLLTFIEATDEEQADQYLASLIEEHAVPIVKEILGSSLRFHLDNNGSASTQDANDLFNDIVANLLSRLRQIRSDSSRGVIADLRGYIAATAYNACNLYLRQKYPRRSRLKNRLRYLLSHDPDFALWSNEVYGLIGGLAQWRDKSELTPQRTFEKIRQDPVEWSVVAGLRSVGTDRAQLSSLLKALFQSCGSPIRLDDLVNIVADICREKDQPDEPLETVLNLVAPALDYETVFEQKRMLALLWQEICQLPPRQRVALLLNFRDVRGQDLLSLLPFTRTATIEQIAEAIELPLEEFLGLWNKLPLDDATIAELLGATRQQVINLRKCARERLERRIRAVIAKNSVAK
jgi:RNA polymerase sigma factor (sigma-70 family)